MCVSVPVSRTCAFRSREMSRQRTPVIAIRRSAAAIASVSGEDRADSTSEHFSERRERSRSSIGAAPPPSRSAAAIAMARRCTSNVYRCTGENSCRSKVLTYVTYVSIVPRDRPSLCWQLYNANPQWVATLFNLQNEIYSLSILKRVGV
jgi:hypothetical protein